MTDSITVVTTSIFAPDEADGVSYSHGSSLLMRCNDGYVLASGQLNITCMGDNWITFPTCVPNVRDRSTTTMITPSSGTVPCMIDRATTFNIINGFLSSTSSLSFTSETTVTGS